MPYIQSKFVWIFKNGRGNKFHEPQDFLCRSAASITGGGVPKSQSSLYMETSSPRPNSRKDGGTTLSKEG